MQATAWHAGRSVCFNVFLLGSVKRRMTRSNVDGKRDDTMFFMKLIQKFTMQSEVPAASPALLTLFYKHITFQACQISIEFFWSLP